MTSNVSKTILEVHNSFSSQTLGWDDCPVEILLLIFEALDVTSLRCCLLVNTRWKEIVIDICESQGLWQDLAEDGIVNFGVTHLSKSTLCWKDLYFNSLLWNNVQLATISKIHELQKQNIKNIHVHKDSIIVVNSANVEYYNIGDFKCVNVISLSCEDFQETDDMIIIVSNNNTIYYKLTLFCKSHYNNDFKQIENHFISGHYDEACEIGQCWRWLIHENSCYIIDWKCVLWRINVTNNKWNVKSVAKYYGGFQYSMENTMNAIHVLKEEIYVSLKWGDLIKVLRYSLAFRKIPKADIPTYFITGPSINKRLPYNEFLDKFSAFINVPFATGFMGDFQGRDKLHFHFEDPEMTCGKQHGDVVFLGYENGRVEIRLLKNHFRSPKPEIELNVKDLDKDAIEDPAVTGLEVCEVKNKHLLFIKTSCKLYQVLFKYPEILLES